MQGTDAPEVAEAVKRTALPTRLGTAHGTLAPASVSLAVNCLAFSRVARLSCGSWERVTASPTCEDACDLNDDGALGLVDAICALTALFANGPAPLPPYDACGVDPTPCEPLLCEQGTCP